MPQLPHLMRRGELVLGTLCGCLVLCVCAWYSVLVKATQTVKTPDSLQLQCEFSEKLDGRNSKLVRSHSGCCSIPVSGLLI